MCSTKRKIADCVIELSKKKDISKISIQDVMNSTNMSRQSFYYHFKDIYDVLEWIALNDFADAIMSEEGESFQDWINKVYAYIDSDRLFYERLVNEIHLSRLLPYLVRPVEKCISQLIDNELAALSQDKRRRAYILNMLTTSTSYEILSYITSKNTYDKNMVSTNFSNIEILFGETQFTVLSPEITISA